MNKSVDVQLNTQSLPNSFYIQVSTLCTIIFSGKISVAPSRHARMHARRDTERCTRKKFQWEMVERFFRMHTEIHTVKHSHYFEYLCILLGDYLQRNLNLLLLSPLPPNPSSSQNKLVNDTTWYMCVCLLELLIVSNVNLTQKIFVYQTAPWSILKRATTKPIKEEEEEDAEG